MKPAMRQETARLRLAELFAHPATAWAVHYACQSFYQGERLGSPRVTSIAFRNLASGQTQSFSFHQLIELKRLPPVRVLRFVEDLERELLDGYYEFLRLNRNMRFVHWHMRDANFGFAAIDHRYRVLGGEPFGIHDANTYDLSRIMTDRYGNDYVPAPRLLNLAEKNGFGTAGYLDGDAEADGFEHGRYQAVLKSNLRKVALITDIVAAAHAGSLKTNATLWTRHGGRLTDVAHSVWGNPLLRIAGVVFSGVSAGLYLGTVLGVF